MYTYDEFWDLLSSSYPISQGSLKLPICTQIVSLPHLDVVSLMQQCTTLLENLCSMYSRLDTLVDAAHQNNEGTISGLLSGTFTGVVRLDCVVDASGTPKILEINADYPDGLLMHDATYSLLSGAPTTKNLDGYLQLFEHSDTIFILYPLGSTFVDAYYTEYNLLSQHGYHCFIGTEKDLSLEGGCVFFEGERIDVIRRCTEVGKFSPSFLQALSCVDVRFINTFDLRVLGYKHILSHISSPLMPKTFPLDGSVVQDVVQHKDAYVIKPSNLFEGKGVVIGANVDLSLWQSELSAHIDDNYIVQEFVDMQKMKVRMYEDGCIVDKELYFDFCPHFFVKNGKVVGEGLVLMRFSEQRILNVAQGGGIGYLGIV